MNAKFANKKSGKAKAEIKFPDSTNQLRAPALLGMSLTLALATNPIWAKMMHAQAIILTYR